MILDTGSQLLVLAVSMVSGLLAGVLYWANIALAELSKNNRVIKFILDFGYVIAVLGGLFVVCNSMNYGVVRWYIVLSYALGMWLMLKTVLKWKYKFS